MGRPAAGAARHPRASAKRSSRISSRITLTSSPYNSLQQSLSSSNRYCLLIQSPIVPSPTILVPEPGTRHREEMAASQTPTVPVPTAPEQIESPGEEGEEEEAAHKAEDDESGGDGGYESETVKADSEDGENHHNNICDEVKVDAVKGEESEHKMTEGEATYEAPISTGSDGQAPVVDADEATNSEFTAGISSVREERMATPPIDVDVSSLTSDDDGDEEFYDSPEGPDGFDAFSVP